MYSGKGNYLHPFPWGMAKFKTLVRKPTPPGQRGWSLTLTCEGNMTWLASNWCVNITPNSEEKDFIGERVPEVRMMHRELDNSEKAYRQHESGTTGMGGCRPERHTGQLTTAGFIHQKLRACPNTFSVSLLALLGTQPACWKQEIHRHTGSMQCPQ